MAHPNVIAAVKGRLGTTWGPDSLRISYPNDPDTQAGEATFIQVQFPASHTQRHTVAPGVYTEEGGIRFIVNGQMGFGLDEVAPICEALAALFRDQNFQGVKTWAPGSAVYDDSNDNGQFFTAAFVAPYTYNYRA